MNAISLHKVIVYHDETKDVPGRNFKGHILLFIPITLSVSSDTPLFGKNLQEHYPQRMLFEKLVECRNEFSCDGKLHFSEISGRTWKKYDFAYRRSIDLIIDALRRKSSLFFPYPLNCKFAVVFYPKGADWSLYGGDSRKEQKLRHDETLLRILLKGGAHYLYDESNLIEVASIISDGDSAHRDLNEDRVVWRLTYDDFYGRNPLRGYVSFSPNASIVHLPSDHKQYMADTAEYMHAHFLQIADLLLGSVMRSCYIGIKPRKLLPNVGEECVKRDIIAQPVKEMLDKKGRGAGFRHSGHYRSFAITQVSFDKDGIHFQEVQSLQFQDEDSLQLSLFSKP